MEDVTSLLQNVQLLTASAIVLSVLLTIAVCALWRRRDSEVLASARMGLKPIGAARGWAAWGLSRVAIQCDDFVHCSFPQLLSWVDGRLLSGWLLRASKKALNVELAKLVRQRQTPTSETPRIELVGIGGGIPFGDLRHQLLIHVIEGHHLAARHRGKEHSDAYCVLEVDDPEQKAQQTTVVKKKSNPEWNEVFAFNLTDCCTVINLSVYHSDRLRKNECLGKLSFPVPEVPDDKPLNRTFYLEMPEGWEDEASSSVTLRVERKAIPEWEKAMQRAETTTRRSRSRSRSRERSQGTSPRMDRFDRRSSKGESPKVASQQIKELRMRRAVSSPFATVPVRDELAPTIRVEAPSPDYRKKSFEVPDVEVNNCDHENGSASSNQSHPSSPSSEKRLSLGEEAVAMVTHVEAASDDPPSGHLQQERNTSPEIDPNARTSSKGHRRSHSADGQLVGMNNLSASTNSLGTDYGDDEPDGISIGSVSSGRSLVGSQGSTLVIKTKDNPPKYYLIPSSMSQHKRHGIKGQKLHVFNDHVFVATHFSRHEAYCVVCSKMVEGFGKQGYLCKGCGIQCHKSCHSLVEEHCTSHLVNTMTLTFYGETTI